VHIGFISLGCSKNRVDTEIMMGLLKGRGHRIVHSLDQAEILVINTCGFIEAAKSEAIDTILESALRKTVGQLRYLVATGCLSQRYGQELLDEIPELDAVVGISCFHEIADVVDLLLEGKRVLRVEAPPDIFKESGPRILTTPAGSAYLKITEGCNNHCSYCAIPSIKGRLRSRPLPELMKEAGDLADRGVKELVLVAQDTAAYGTDIYRESKLPDLLRSLSGINELEWIRLMYLHPAHINDELIDVIGGENKVLPYMDIPVQHASDLILKNMNRGHDSQYLEDLITKLRSQIEKLVLRTTVMVGFPGETDNDFQTLLRFIKEMEFDWLGAFRYSPEEGTTSAVRTDQIDGDTAESRLTQLQRIQQRITREKNVARVGRHTNVLVSSRIKDNLYTGRSYFQAPEVDGVTLIKSPVKLNKGTLVEVDLRGVRNIDMIGEVVL